MKIRCDFVTNSSSSSFVAVSIRAGVLDSYLQKNDLQDIFEKLDGLFESLSENGDTLQVELDKSIAKSLVAILEAIVAELDCGAIDEDAYDLNLESIQNLIKFIKKNIEYIDAEAEGSIEMKYSCGEDGYAYVQSIEYKKHHGKLVKWPCSDGWNYQNGGGYSKIQEFNSRMFNGEIQELVDLAYDAIWDIIWDDEALTTAIEKTGIVEEFEILPADQKNVDFENDLSLEEVEPINVEWIANALFVLTGLNENEEAIATDIIQDNGGVIKSSVVLKTNYLIYNPYYDHETTKLKKAKELIDKGKNIKLLTVSEFCKMLITLGSGEIIKAPEKKVKPLPKTMEECSKIYDCYISDGRVAIKGIKKNSAEITIPGEIDGMPVMVSRSAFSKNRKIEKVIFSEGVVAIDSDAFCECKLLKEVVFSSSIQAVGSGIFRRTPWMDAKGDWFIINGILISYTGNDSEVIIPEGITKINNHAFSSMGWDWSSKQKLQSVVIPESVTYIGDSAFNSCKNLKNIVLPDHEIELGVHPFSGTAWENEQQDWVILRGTLLGVTDDFYYSHFRESTSLMIPEGVRVIGKNTNGFGLRKWENVKTIVLPEGLEIIEESAFAGFKKLEEINLPSTLTRIGKNAFSGCESLSKISFPDGLKEIGDSAFSGWNDAPKMEEVFLPETVERIGARAFAYCKKLKKLKFPKKLDIIPNALVHSCNSLEEVIMPEESRIIGDDAFESCETLTNIKIPAGVEEMGRRVFYGCVKLQGLELPDTVRRFGWATFKRCDSFTKVVIPEGVEVLDEELFLHCNVLEKVVVPSTVKSIEGRVFEECPELTVVVPKDSYAEEYVKKNNIPYEIK